MFAKRLRPILIIALIFSTTTYSKSINKRGIDIVRLKEQAAKQHQNDQILKKANPDDELKARAAYGPTYKAQTVLGKFYDDLPLVNEHFKNKNIAVKAHFDKKFLAIQKKSEMIENFRKILQNAREKMKELRAGKKIENAPNAYLNKPNENEMKQNYDSQNYGKPPNMEEEYNENDYEPGKMEKVYDKRAGGNQYGKPTIEEETDESNHGNKPQNMDRIYDKGTGKNKYGKPPTTQEEYGQNAYGNKPLNMEKVYDKEIEQSKYEKPQIMQEEYIQNDYGNGPQNLENSYNKRTGQKKYGKPLMGEEIVESRFENKPQKMGQYGKFQNMQNNYENKPQNIKEEMGQNYYASKQQNTKFYDKALNNYGNKPLNMEENTDQNNYGNRPPEMEEYGEKTGKKYSKYGKKPECDKNLEDSDEQDLNYQSGQKYGIKPMKQNTYMGPMNQEEYKNQEMINYQSEQKYEYKKPSKEEYNKEMYTEKNNPTNTYDQKYEYQPQNMDSENEISEEAPVNKYGKHPKPYKFSEDKYGHKDDEEDISKEYEIEEEYNEKKHGKATKNKQYVFKPDTEKRYDGKKNGYGENMEASPEEQYVLGNKMRALDKEEDKPKKSHISLKDKKPVDKKQGKKDDFSKDSDVIPQNMNGNPSISSHPKRPIKITGPPNSFENEHELKNNADNLKEEAKIIKQNVSKKNVETVSSTKDRETKDIKLPKLSKVGSTLEEVNNDAVKKARALEGKLKEFVDKVGKTMKDKTTNENVQTAETTTPEIIIQPKELEVDKPFQKPIKGSQKNAVQMDQPKEKVGLPVKEPEYTIKKSETTTPGIIVQPQDLDEEAPKKSSSKSPIVGTFLHSPLQELIAPVQETPVEESLESQEAGSSFQRAASNDDSPVRESDKFHAIEMEQLRFLREEISTIRSLMELLKEHQHQEKISKSSSHLSPKEMREIQEKLDVSKFTNPLFGKNSGDRLPMSPGLDFFGDMNELQSTVKKIDERLNVMIINKGEVNEVVQKLKDHEQEIETLRKLLDSLINAYEMKQPMYQNKEIKNSIRQFKNMLKDFDSVKNENVLDFSKSRSRASSGSGNEETLRKLQERIDMLTGSREEPETKSNGDLDDFLSIFDKLTNRNERKGKGLESKLEKLEKELKEIENENKRTKQELKIAQMEREIESLVDTKNKFLKESEKIAKKNSKAKIMEEIEKMKDKISKHSEPKPEERQLVDVEAELQELQKEIDKLSPKPEEKENGVDIDETPKEKQNIDDLFSSFGQTTELPSTAGDLFTSGTSEAPEISNKFGNPTNSRKYPQNYQAVTVTPTTVTGFGLSSAGSASAQVPSREMIKNIRLPPFSQKPSKIIYQMPFCLQPLYHQGSPGTQFKQGNISQRPNNSNYQGKTQQNSNSGSQSLQEPNYGQGNGPQSDFGSENMQVPNYGQGNIQEFSGSGNQNAQGPSYIQGNNQKSGYGVQNLQEPNYGKGNNQDYSGSGSVQGPSYSAQQPNNYGINQGSNYNGQESMGTYGNQGQNLAPEKFDQSTYYNQRPIPSDRYQPQMSENNPQFSAGYYQPPPQFPDYQYPSRSEYPEPNSNSQYRHKTDDAPLASESILGSPHRHPYEDSDEIRPVDHVEKHHANIRQLKSEIYNLENKINRYKSAKMDDNVEENINMLENLLKAYEENESNENTRKKRSAEEEDKEWIKVAEEKMQDLKNQMVKITDPKQRENNLLMLKTLEKELSIMKNENSERSKLKEKKSKSTDDIIIENSKNSSSKLETQVNELKQRLKDLGKISVDKPDSTVQTKLEDLEKKIKQLSGKEESSEIKPSNSELFKEIEQLKNKLKDIKSTTEKSRENPDKKLVTELEELKKKLRELQPENAPTTEKNKPGESQDSSEEKELLAELDVIKSKLKKLKKIKTDGKPLEKHEQELKELKTETKTIADRSKKELLTELEKMKTQLKESKSQATDKKSKVPTPSKELPTEESEKHAKLLAEMESMRKILDDLKKSSQNKTPAVKNDKGVKTVDRKEDPKKIETNDVGPESKSISVDLPKENKKDSTKIKNIDKQSKDIKKDSKQLKDIGNPSTVTKEETSGTTTVLPLNNRFKVLPTKAVEKIENRAFPPDELFDTTGTLVEEVTQTPTSSDPFAFPSYNNDPYNMPKVVYQIPMCMHPMNPPNPNGCKCDDTNGYSIQNYPNNQEFNKNQFQQNFPISPGQSLSSSQSFESNLPQRPIPNIMPAVNAQGLYETTPAPTLVPTGAIDTASSSFLVTPTPIIVQPLQTNYSAPTNQSSQNYQPSSAQILAPNAVTAQIPLIPNQTNLSPSTPYLNTQIPLAPNNQQDLSRPVAPNNKNQYPQSPDYKPQTGYASDPVYTAPNQRPQQSMITGPRPGQGPPPYFPSQDERPQNVDEYSHVNGKQDNKYYNPNGQHEYGQQTPYYPQKPYGSINVPISPISSGMQYGPQGQFQHYQNTPVSGGYDKYPSGYMPQSYPNIYQSKEQEYRPEDHQDYSRPSMEYGPSGYNKGPKPQEKELSISDSPSEAQYAKPQGLDQRPYSKPVSEGRYEGSSAGYLPQVHSSNVYQSKGPEYRPEVHQDYSRPPIEYGTPQESYSSQRPAGEYPSKEYQQSENKYEAYPLDQLQAGQNDYEHKSIQGPKPQSGYSHNPANEYPSKAYQPDGHKYEVYPSDQPQAGPENYEQKYTSGPKPQESGYTQKPTSEYPSKGYQQNANKYEAQPQAGQNGYEQKYTQGPKPQSGYSQNPVNEYPSDGYQKSGNKYGAYPLAQPQTGDNDYQQKYTQGPKPQMSGYSQKPADEYPPKGYQQSGHKYEVYPSDQPQSAQKDYEQKYPINKYEETEKLYNAPKGNKYQTPPVNPEPYTSKEYEQKYPSKTPNEGSSKYEEPVKPSMQHSAAQGEYKPQGHSKKQDNVDKYGKPVNQEELYSVEKGYEQKYPSKTPYEGTSKYEEPAMGYSSVQEGYKPQGYSEKQGNVDKYGGPVNQGRPYPVEKGYEQKYPSKTPYEGTNKYEEPAKPAMEYSSIQGGYKPQGYSEKQDNVDKYGEPVNQGSTSKPPYPVEKGYEQKYPSKTPYEGTNKYEQPAKPAMEYSSIQGGYKPQVYSERQHNMNKYGKPVNQEGPYSVQKEYEQKYPSKVPYEGTSKYEEPAKPAVEYPSVQEEYKPQGYSENTYGKPASYFSQKPQYPESGPYLKPNGYETGQSEDKPVSYETKPQVNPDKFVETYSSKRPSGLEQFGKSDYQIEDKVQDKYSNKHETPSETYSSKGPSGPEQFGKPDYQAEDKVPDKYETPQETYSSKGPSVSEQFAKPDYQAEGPQENDEEERDSTNNDYNQPGPYSPNEPVKKFGASDSSYETPAEQYESQHKPMEESKEDTKPDEETEEYQKSDLEEFTDDKETYSGHGPVKMPQRFGPEREPQFYSAHMTHPGYEPRPYGPQDEIKHPYGYPGSQMGYQGPMRPYRPNYGPPRMYLPQHEPLIHYGPHQGPHDGYSEDVPYGPQEHYPEDVSYGSHQGPHESYPEHMAYGPHAGPNYPQHVPKVIVYTNPDRCGAKPCGGYPQEPGSYYPSGGPMSQGHPQMHPGHPQMHPGYPQMSPGHPGGYNPAFHGPTQKEDLYKRTRHKRSADEEEKDWLASAANGLNELKHEVSTLENRQLGPLRSAYDDYSPRYSHKSKDKYFYPKITIGKKDSKKVKIFDKLFLKIAKFIIHKVGLLGPYLVETFFGIDVTDDKGYDKGYGGYGNSYVADFKQYGIVGLVPAIILKLLSKLNYFVSVLQKNTFLKNFFIPALLILAVNGALAFLVWWLYPQNGLNYYHDLDYNYGGNYGGSYGSNYGNSYGGDYGNNYDEYENSYRNSRNDYSRNSKNYRSNYERERGVDRNNNYRNNYDNFRTSMGAYRNYNYAPEN